MKKHTNNDDAKDVAPTHEDSQQHTAAHSAPEISTEPSSADQSAALGSEPSEPTPRKTPQQPAGEAPAPSHPHFWAWLAAHKKVSALLGCLLVALVLAAVPFTRYKIAGLVLRQNFSVVVLDTQTGKPVSSAHLMLAGQTARTDNKGNATLHVRTGNTTLTVTKQYYKDSSGQVLVPILRQKQPPFRVYLQATGRQVPITITNKITGAPVANAAVKAQGTEAKTDAAGQVAIVLPADQNDVAATITAANYNQASVSITVTAQAIDANKFQITPSGTVYFLSNANGNIDVVKTNLDGSARKTVLAGTGSEEPANTSLLASTDWKYLALLSKRDGGDYAKLFLINTANDQLTTIDEGKVNILLVGWSGHRFIYKVDRSPTVHPWEDNRIAIKSFNADTTQTTTLDQTQADGDQNSSAAQSFDNIYVLDNQVVYTVGWVQNNGSIDMSSKNDSIRGVGLDGQNKKDYKTVSASSGFWGQAVLYQPQAAYFQRWNNDATTSTAFYEYEDGVVKNASVTQSQFQQQYYATYLYSPSGHQTFWSEPRDGKNTLLVGDESAGSPKTIASLSDYAIYGWYTDQYLLISKNGSELYILPLAGGQPMKITDYYKPALTYRGYGGGYGGV